jgi:isopentenyl-diphosphate Delta-isomerase
MENKINPSLSDELAQRKESHLDLAFKAQAGVQTLDQRFNYEPLFFSHPKSSDSWPHQFLGFTLDFPLWVSSMTGGTEKAGLINKRLATLCGKYKLGMGLGSCRPLLNGEERLKDFSLREYMGNQPLLANLGIAQVEELQDEKRTHLIHDLIKKLSADGLIIHINPLQEWLQPEGDRFTRSPLETIRRFMDEADYPVIVKEVGQGMGPLSLKALLELPIAGIEFGAYGGTNFSKLEGLRGSVSEEKLKFTQVGHSAEEMIEVLNALPTRNKEFIISGGIRSVLDGYALKQNMKSNALIGMAAAFLGPAMESETALEDYFLNAREALLTAKGLLSLKGER